MKFSDILLLEESYYDLVNELAQYCYDEIVKNKKTKIDLLPKIQTYFKNNDKEMYDKAKKIQYFTIMFEKKQCHEIAVGKIGPDYDRFGIKGIDINIYHQNIIKKYKSNYFKMLLSVLQHEIKHGIDYIRRIKMKNKSYNDIEEYHGRQRDNILKKIPEDRKDFFSLGDRWILDYITDNMELNANIIELKTILKLNKNAGLHLKNFKDLLKFMYFNYQNSKIKKKSPLHNIDKIKNEPIYNYYKKILINKLNREMLNGRTLLSYFPNLR
jgi:hypothetical protein